MHASQQGEWNGFAAEKPLVRTHQAGPIGGYDDVHPVSQAELRRMLRKQLEA